jgi:exopolyphosphatase/guanosine-5'-triphosphate,3'-diphosphate pyrophosphatase
MDELGLEELRVTDRGLRDGLLVDYLANSEHRRVYSELSVRQRSVFQLARACGSDEDHTRIVGRLALELFDSAAKASLHRLGPRERELLEYAALLHDIGVFLSYDNQHQHAWYLISSADMLGFDQREVTIIAALAFFARRGFPKQEHAKLAGLSDATRRDARMLCAFLRIADSLDRSRRGLVLHATLDAIDRNTVRLRIEGSGDMSLDLWGLEYNRASVERMLGKRLRIEQRLRDRRAR